MTCISHTQVIKNSLPSRVLVLEISGFLGLQEPSHSQYKDPDFFLKRIMFSPIIQVGCPPLKQKLSPWSEAYIKVPEEYFQMSYPHPREILSSLFIFFNSTCMSVLPKMHVCVPCLCLVLKEVRRRHQTPWNWSQSWCEPSHGHTHKTI